MEDLQIHTAENGFIVTECGPEIRHSISKSWAFESAESLAVFIEDWGKGMTKPSMDVSAASL